MRHHGGKVLLELIGLLIGGIAVLGAILFWRLMQGPANIDFAAPFAEAELSRQLGSRVTFSHVALGSSGWGAPVQLLFDTPVIYNQQDTPAITIQSVDISLSFKALIAGQIHPISLVLIHPQIEMSRRANGTYTTGLSQTSDTQSHFSMQSIFTPSPDSRFYNWHKVKVQDGDVIVRNPDGSVLIEAGQIAFDATRWPDAVQMMSSAHVAIGDTTGQISATAEYAGQQGTVRLQASPMPLNLIAGFDPVLDKLAGATSPASFEATADLEGGKIAAATARIDIGAGQITESDEFDAPIPVKAGQIELSYLAQPEKISLDRLSIDFGGPNLDASAVANNEQGAIHFDLNAALSDMPLDSLAQYWPKSLSPHGRDWVIANISHGSIPKVTAHVMGAAPRSDPSAIIVQSLDGEMHPQDGTVHYFGELPSVQGVNADIVFDLDSMTIDLTSGHINNFNLQAGKVVLGGFSEHNQVIAIDVVLSGPIGTALSILNSAPLFYAKKLQLNPAVIAGSTDAKLHLDFPLIQSLEASQMNLLATADLHDLSMPEIFHHMSLNALNGSMQVDQAGLEMGGKGQLGDIQASVDWKQAFNPTDGLITDATFDADINNRQRAELGIDVPDRLDGPVRVSGRYLDFGKTSSVALNCDLTPARFKIDEIGYEKTPGKPGKADFTLKLAHGVLQSIDDIQIKAPDFLAKGNAQLDPGTQALSRLHVSEFRAADSNASIDVSPLPNGGSKIAVTGSVFDARGLLHKRHEKGHVEDTSGDKTPIEIDADLRTVKTSDQNFISDLKGQLLLEGSKWRRAEFSASASGQPIVLSYLPDGSSDNPSYTLHASAADAGAAFAGFALTDAIRGGALQIDGRKDPITPQQPDPPLVASLTLSSFTLVHAPALAKLLSLLSLQGILDAFEHGTLRFDSLTGRFEIDNQTILVRDGKLTSSAIGLTIAGSADRDAATLDMQGTVIPAYSVNKFLNYIPLLGPILTGGAGEGVFAATYSVSGPFEDPKVSVNPLSILAPGVLRDLFFTRSLPDDFESEPKK